MDSPEIVSTRFHGTREDEGEKASVADASHVGNFEELRFRQTGPVDVDDSQIESSSGPSSDANSSTTTGSTLSDTRDTSGINGTIDSDGQSEEPAKSDGEPDKGYNDAKNSVPRPQKFEVKPARHRGLGLFAKVDFLPGQLICEEAPLIVCPAGARSSAEMDSFVRTAMSDLSQEKQDFIIHALSNASSDRAEHHLAGVFRTNALPCGPHIGKGAIFEHIAMANHSCIPNAVYRWNDRTRAGTLVASTQILMNEEVTISYVALSPHSVRQTQLQQSFGFLCDCGLCHLPAIERRAEDARIGEMDGLEITLLYGDPTRLVADPSGSLEKFKRLGELYRESKHVNHHDDINRLNEAIVRLCVARFSLRRAAKRVAKALNVEREEAMELCRESFEKR